MPATNARRNNTARMAVNVLRLLPSTGSLNGLNATMVYPFFIWNKYRFVKSNIVTFENLLVTPLDKGLPESPFLFIC
jgi:hypothetical protein